MAQSTRNVDDGATGNRTWEITSDDGRTLAVDRTGAASYLPGNQRNDLERVREVARDVIQHGAINGSGWDQRTLLTDLPIDDPDRTTDPAQFSWFHARVVPEEQIGNGANRVEVYRAIAEVGGVATHIVSRQDLIRIVGDSIADLSIAWHVPNAWR